MVELLEDGVVVGGVVGVWYNGVASVATGVPTEVSDWTVPRTEGPLLKLTTATCNNHQEQWCLLLQLTCDVIRNLACLWECPRSSYMQARPPWF